MPRQSRILAPLLLLAVAVGLAGCIGGAPQLTVTPEAINIGAGETTGAFRIQNTGGGLLTYTVSEEIPWLALDDSTKQTDSLSGTTTTDLVVINLLIDRSQLTNGVNNGEITVASNGGTEIVNVSASLAGPAQLSVSSTDLDFGASRTEEVVVLSNQGSETLNFSASVDAASEGWLSASPSAGTIAGNGATQSLTLSVDREGLAPGDYNGTVTVTSSGGDATIQVLARVTAFNVTPNQIEFDLINAPASSPVTISNLGDAALDLTLSSDDGGAGWLAFSGATSVTVPASSALDVLITVDPTGLAAGAYMGSFTVADSDAGVSISVPVKFRLSALSVAPETIDFGVITAPASDTFTLTNADTPIIAYGVVVPAEDAAWLSVSPTSGNLSGTQDIQVDVDPLAVNPGEYQSTIVINFADGPLFVDVSMTRPRPARLVVVSSDINLGTTGLKETVDLWNDGLGTVNWLADVSDFPVWLTPTALVDAGETGTGDTFSGSLTGDDLDSIELTVDRSTVPPRAEEYVHTFNIVGSGDVSVTIPVTVRMRGPLVPVLVLEGDGTDTQNVPFVNIDVDSTSGQFIVRNVGTGTLDWNVDLTALPESGWIKSFQPAQSSLEANTEILVTIVIDQSVLDFNGAQTSIFIQSNDPEQDDAGAPIIVEVQVAKSISITTDSGSLAFGLNDSVLPLFIANDGDPNTILNYRVTANKEWLDISLRTGKSVGVASPFKDFQEHTVTVDRALLEGSGASGILIIEAFALENGQQVPVEDIEPATVNVSVETNSLTFETAKPRLRVPSLVRYVLLMRDISYAPIEISDSGLSGLVEQIGILENDEPLEERETQKIAKPIESARGNALILLDYSGSMQKAARAVEDAAISGASDPIQVLYEQTIAPLIDDIPSNYRVGIAIFNERVQDVLGPALRPLYGTAAEGPATENELFITDRDLLKQRLSEVTVVDNGATELLPAIIDASRAIVEEDAIVGIFPFDDADMRLLICVTDGRLTTPPGETTVVTQVLEEHRTRFMVVGWGEDVFSAPLVEIATETGGHVYATRNESTDAVDAFGDPITKPTVAALADWTMIDDTDPCDLSIVEDLEAQYVFGYVTLREEPNIEIEGSLAFNPQNDADSPCLDEQGTIDGTFVKDQNDLFGVAGDPRLGQISLFHEGRMPDGFARVVANLDAAPRNLSSFTLRMETVGADALAGNAVNTISSADFGLLSGWTASRAGNEFTFTSPDGPLLYGDWGGLFTVNVTGIDPGALLRVSVVDPVIDEDDDNTKYLTVPDSVSLSSSAYLATSFPSPTIFVSAVNPPDATFGFTSNEDFDTNLLLELGTDINSVTLDIANFGGAHGPTDVWLNYTIALNGNTAGFFTVVPTPANIDLDDLAGEIISTEAPESFIFTPNRDLAPGSYGVHVNGALSFTLAYDFNTVNLGGETLPIFFTYTIDPPLLDAPTAPIDFNTAALASQTINVFNAGQSLLTWGVDFTVPFPAWLSVTPSESTIAGDEASEVTIAVDATGFLSGFTETYNLTILDFTDSTLLDEDRPRKVIPITLTVP